MEKFLINILFFLFTSNLVGQEEITIVGDFLPYEAYYIGSIDLITGESNVQLFNFLISSTAAIDAEGQYVNPVLYYAGFKLEVLSPDLGFNEQETIIEVQTKNMISMRNPINLDNRDFNFNSVNIFDITGEEVLDENGESIMIDVIDKIDIESHEKILSAITSMGKLPDGEYTLSFRLFGGNIDEEVNRVKTINVSTPTSVNLIYPGGSLSDTTQNVIYTPYPIFQWSTETCFSCELFIRVAEFNPAFHNSLEDAIEDITSCPVNQTQGWETIGNTSFQYPITGAKELEEGKLYVWQIKKEFQTTLGIESYLSSISIFKIAKVSIENTNTSVLSDPILFALKEVLGEESFKIYFGLDGELTNYLPNNVYRINKENCNSTDILRIIEQLRSGTISIIDLNVE